jgi:hypothetical protein
MKASERKIYDALLTAFNRVREGGTDVPFFSDADLVTMAQSIHDDLALSD